MAKAELTFENITFRPLGGGWCTVGRITNQIGDNGRVRVSGARIKNNGVGPIEITIGNSANYPSDGQITPKGFALVEKTNTGDPCGEKNFNSRSHSERNHTIRMQALAHTGGGATWKLVIMIQHDDGRVGVIDPDVENDN